MSCRYIHWPEDSPAGAALGGKASALARLHGSGLPAPPWFVVLPQAFEDSVSPARWQVLGAAEGPGALEPADEVRLAVGQALAQLCPEGELVAVRSSARNEDGEQASFAGQLRSFLGVPASEVADHVARVWESAFAPQVRAYRVQHQIPADEAAPAVLVQRLLNAEVSGVAFGADPVSGRRDVVVISAVHGLGTTLVDGEADGALWRVDSSGMIFSSQRGSQPREARPGPQGVEKRPLAPDKAASAVLTEPQVREVAALVRQAGDFFGKPQDVEWAYESGKLWLLQSRPMTSLVEAPVPSEGSFDIWDNSNIIESYSGVTTPLTFSFAQRAYEGVYRQFCRMMAVPGRKIAAHDQTFRNMLGLLRGRVYYNLLNWYRVLALLPGFKVNRRFMEQMMGVKEPMPDEIIAGLDQAGMGARLKDSANLLCSITALAAGLLRLPGKIRRFYGRLAGALRPPERPLETLSLRELAACFARLENSLLKRWDAPLLNDFFTMIFYGVLRGLTAKWGGDEDGTLQNDLLCGGGGMISSEPARRITDLAHLARGHESLVNSLRHGSREEIETAMVQVPAFHAAVRDYLARFGDRCFEELKLETRVLAEEPLPLYRAMGNLAGLPATVISSSQESPAPDPRLAAEERMARALRGRPFRKRVFRWVLRHARSGVRERENLRFERTRLFGLVRRIFAGMGRRLQEQGHLQDARDVFYLEVDELLRFAAGAATSNSLGALAQVRKQEFVAYRQAESLPGRIITRGVPWEHLRQIRGAAPVPEAVEEGEERRGTGCCPGTVRGRVCRITRPAEQVMRAGEILVAERTDPGWIMLFPAAAGLLVERGSLLSHSAIVARELRLPAIVAITGLTSWLKDGDWVEFDGATGVVKRINAPADAEAAAASLNKPMAAPNLSIGTGTNSLAAFRS